MKYQVTVLTPTLTGDGSRLSAIDYMVWRDQVNVLDQTRIFRLLAKGPRLEGYLTQLRKASRLDFASWGGFAQNYADRRVPFEDPAYAQALNSAPPESLAIPTFASVEAGPFLPGAALKGALRTALIFSRVKPEAAGELAAKLKGERLPRRPAEQFERQGAGEGGSDRMRAIQIGDSSPVSRDDFRVHMLRLSSLAARGTNQYALAWKPNLSFAEMASPGVVFTGDWRENAFLNNEEVRKVLRWSQPVTHKTLFDAANRYAAKQLEIHAQYAKWTALEPLAQSVAQLQQRLESAQANGCCLLAIGWGAGFLSKSAAIGTEDAGHRALLALMPYYQRAIQTGLPFPKTRRVVFLKNKPATLPGWVELRISE
jgi:CRISPR-associated protein Csm5